MEMSRHTGMDLLFYQRNNVVTVTEGEAVNTIFRVDDVSYAHYCGRPDNRSLLATDAMGSVLRGPTQDDLCYTPYGYTSQNAKPSGFIGFNGELLAQQLAGYLLGNGYRIYRPSLMRMGSPDNLSPFADGGRNAYTYCLGDPVNNTDPTGRVTQPRWRAPTTEVLRRLRTSELSGDRRGIRAIENALNDLARQEVRRTQRHRTAPVGNLNLRIPSTHSRLQLDPTYLQPTPSRQIPEPQRPQQSARTPGRSSGSTSPFAGHPSSSSSTSRDSSPSSVRSSDSWDEWRPNPDDERRQSAEGIARAIRDARN